MENNGPVLKKTTNVVQIWCKFEDCGVVLLFLYLQISLSTAEREIKVFMSCRSIVNTIDCG